MPCVRARSVRSGAATMVRRLVHGLVALARISDTSDSARAPDVTPHQILGLSISCSCCGDKVNDAEWAQSRERRQVDGCDAGDGAFGFRLRRVSRAARRLKIATSGRSEGFVSFVGFSCRSAARTSRTRIALGSRWRRRSQRKERLRSLLLRAAARDPV
jgi:hypothetical protein